MQERYTKQAENVLALAKEAASSCGHSYIGTEHLLVGLVEEKEGTAGRVLEEFGIQADKAMALIDKLIDVYKRQHYGRSLRLTKPRRRNLPMC